MKQTYYRTRCLKYRGDSRKTWNLINQVLNKTKNKSCCISQIDANGINYFNNLDIPNLFCKYFANIGSDLSEKNTK